MVAARVNSVEGRAGPAVEALVRDCRAAGLRVTPVLRALLEVLARREEPIRIQQCAAEDPELGRCDPATLYRLFGRLEEQGIVRQIGMHGRSAWFGLADSLRHRHYLCCRRCGKVEPLRGECLLAETEKRIAEEHGYSGLTHELTFHGVCPACA